jgi:hypothetical protein
MKRVLLLSLAVVSVGCSSSKSPPVDEPSQHGSGQHAGHGTMNESAILMVHSEPVAPSAGQKVALKLMIHQADGTMVREFDIVHEKLVHLIIVRDGLDEFAHVHPAVDDQGNLTITHTFPKAGKYRLFADYKPKDKATAIARGEIEVSGEPSSAPTLVGNAPGKVTADGLVAQIELQNAVAGQSSEILFRLANLSGQPIDDLQPYLGSRGHLVVISAGGTQYVHAHPMDVPASPNEVVFMCHFPTGGMYKGWAQFQVAGQVLTMPFVVTIP